MSKNNSFENAFQLLMFNNTDIANIGDAAGIQGSSSAGNLYAALLTADPTESGSTANECAYGGYARQPIPRSSAGFTVSNNVVTNAAAITFPQATSGSETATYFAIMTAETGGTMLYSKSLNSSLLIETDSIPKINAGGLTVTED